MQKDCSKLLLKNVESQTYLQDDVKFRAFLSKWMFSKALEARITSLERSSSYLQLYSSFRKLEEPILRSEAIKLDRKINKT